MGFIDGNIVRILMQDFLTFDNMEVIPKPNLNVIIGPNGTGKSTIMCGLALALSNKSAVTGRGKEVGEYVKHGKDSASIEVEIHRKQKNKTNLVVKRVITRANGSQFYVQGEKASFKEVETHLKKLSIQLDNLCQFLPQDRVVEFAKMNNVQLLENTEKTVGGADLYEQHERVRSSGGEVSQLRTRLTQIQQQHQQETNKNASVEAEVRNHQERERLDIVIEELRTRRLWFLYTQQRGLHLEKKKIKEQISNELSRLKERWQPEAEQIEKFKTSADWIKTKIKVEERVVASISSESSGLESRWVEFEESRQDSVRDYQAKEDRHKQQQVSLQSLNKQLATIQREIDEDSKQQNTESEASQQRTINDLTIEAQNIGSEVNALQQRLLQSRNKHNNTRMELQHMTDEIERIQDTARRRMQLLQQRHADAYHAALWLQKNTDQFANTVYPPICTQLNIQPPNMAQYVEDRIPRADLIAFVCRDKDDVNLLKRLTDEQGWAVNIVHSNSESMQEFQPKRPEAQIRQLGFEMYLLSAVEGPPAVLNYICKTYQLHNIPVATSDGVVRVQALPNDIPRFYINDSRYHHSKSRYSNDVMTNLCVVQRPNLLTVTVQTQRIKSLHEQMQLLQEQSSESEQEAKEMEKQEQGLMETLENKRRLKQQLQHHRNHRKTLIARLEQKEAQISRTEKDKVDLDAARKVKEHKMQNATRSALAVVKGWSDLAGRLSTAKLGLATQRSRYKTLADITHELMVAVQDMEEKLAAKGRELIEATAAVKDMVHSGQETLALLLKALGLASALDINNSVRNQFTTGVQGMQGTDQALMEKEAHRDCLVTADDQVVAEYNRRNKQINSLSMQLEKLHEEEQRRTGHMAEQRAEWLANVAELTTKINASFSALMARMKCAGEVKLSKPENEDDLAKYGLSICVRFRGSEKLRELTAHQQSGGERAVSTALYLLSLQSMSAVPFRCADEINQGMDAENERLMFTMLVEHMTERNASQYFLVTPKLLPNLPYNDRVNFICVFNGPKISTQMSLKDAIRRKQAITAPKGAKSRKR